MSTKYIIFVVFELFSIVGGQVSGLGRYGCQVESGISVLPACDSLNATLYSCFKGVEQPASNQSCFCQQSVVNSIFDCESEFRLCYQNDRFDYFPESVMKNWHDQCDDYVTFSPTTPVLSNPTTTRPTIVAGTIEPFCTDFLTSCGLWSSAEVQCLALDPDLTASSALDCACSTSLLSLASVCLYDTNITCLGTDAHLSDVSLFDICGKTYSNGQIIMADTTRSTVAETSNTATPRTVPSSAVSQTSVPSQVVPITSSAAQSAASALPSSGSADCRPIGFDNSGTRIFVIVILTMILGFT